MSAELLREAAGLMRERAEGATAGAWESFPSSISVGASNGWAVWMLAVAGWLDSVADRYDQATTVKGEDVDRAATVARAYLGRDA